MSVRTLPQVCMCVCSPCEYCKGCLCVKARQLHIKLGHEKTSLYHIIIAYHIVIQECKDDNV